MSRRRRKVLRSRRRLPAVSCDYCSEQKRIGVGFSVWKGHMVGNHCKSQIARRDEQAFLRCLI